MNFKINSSVHCIKIQGPQFVVLFVFCYLLQDVHDGITPVLFGEIVHNKFPFGVFLYLRSEFNNVPPYKVLSLSPLFPTFPRVHSCVTPRVSCYLPVTEILSSTNPFHNLLQRVRTGTSQDILFLSKSKIRIISLFGPLLEQSPYGIRPKIKFFNKTDDSPFIPSCVLSSHLSLSD